MGYKNRWKTPTKIKGHEGLWYPADEVDARIAELETLLKIKGDALAELCPRYKKEDWDVLKDAERLLAELKGDTPTVGDEPTKAMVAAGVLEYRKGRHGTPSRSDTEWVVSVYKAMRRAALQKKEK